MYRIRHMNNILQYMYSNVTTLTTSQLHCITIEYIIIYKYIYTNDFILIYFVSLNKLQIYLFYI